MSKDELLRMLRAECDKAGGIRAWGRMHGISAPYVSDVLRENRHPGPAILSVLGVEVEPAPVSYRKVKVRFR